MKTVIALLIGLVCGVGAYAQNNSFPEKVIIGSPVLVLPDTARYQLIRFSSEILVKFDRFTGKTFAYDRNGNRWRLLDVRGGLPAGAPGTTPQYQIYNEGENYPLLINNETGQTWYFNGFTTWTPITN